MEKKSKDMLYLFCKIDKESIGIFDSKVDIERLQVRILRRSRPAGSMVEYSTTAWISFLQHYIILFFISVYKADQMLEQLKKIV